MKAGATANRRTSPTNGAGKPTWDVALLFPPQGQWTESDYLALEASGGNRMIELDDGFIEILPMPKPRHQRIVQHLYDKMRAWAIQHKTGEPFVAPMPIRLWEDQMREPDLMFLKPGRVKDPDEPPDGADFTLEVISPGTEARNRDLRKKRSIYARAGIPEYWVVDPVKKQIITFTLAGKRYRTHGKFKPGDKATSKVLTGFSVDVTDVFSAGEGKLS